jgi:hypothetical protein
MFTVLTRLLKVTPQELAKIERAAALARGKAQPQAFSLGSLAANLPGLQQAYFGGAGGGAGGGARGGGGLGGR